MNQELLTRFEMQIDWISREPPFLDSFRNWVWISVRSVFGLTFPHLFQWHFSRCGVYHYLLFSSSNGLIPLTGGWQIHSDAVNYVSIWFQSVLAMVWDISKCTSLFHLIATWIIYSWICVGTKKRKHCAKSNVSTLAILNNCNWCCRKLSEVN